MKELQRSFAGGVIAPEAFGRLDMTKYQTGLSEAENFVVLPHGPIQNRAGTEYVMHVKDSSQPTVVIPFIYSSTQSYALQFGNGYMRIHTNGGSVLETAKAITAVSIAAAGVATIPAHAFTTNDIIFISALVGPTGLNGRFIKASVVDANNVALLDLNGAAISTLTMSAYVSGGLASRVYEIATPFLTADLFDLHYTQDADVLTFTHPNYPQQELRRLGATNWTLTPVVFTPVSTQPTGSTVSASPTSGTVRQRYKVTAVATTGLEESLGTQPAASSAGTAITAITRANPGVVTAVAHGRALADNVTIRGVLGMTQINDLDLRIGNVVDANNVSLVYPDGTAVDTTAFTAWTSGGLLHFTDVINDLTTSGNKNTISWTPNGALRYNVYKNRNGIYGYIGQTNQNSLVDQNITQNESYSPPEVEDAFTGANNYPQAVGYFQGRRWFAGTNSKKQNAWATRSGTDSNMTYSLPTRSDDRISFKLKARQANQIRHIVPMSTLLFLTSGGEWRIASSQGNTLTPTTIDPIPDAAVGASNVQPILHNSSALYMADRGGRMREIQFSWENSGYSTSDVSLLTPHYFDSYTIKQLAFARSPHPFAWGARSDGVLLGMTYVPDQSVRAWHSHLFTNGLVESICVVPEGNEDVLYLSIKRTLQGATVRCIERMHSRLFTTLADCYFVDCGLSYSGAAISVVDFGLWHLEGQTVYILGDGATHPSQVVTGGKVTLQSACSKIAVGVNIRARAKTLPLAMEIEAMGGGTPKNIGRAFLRVDKTSSLKAGPSYDRVREFKQRTTENMGSPPNVVSAEAQIVLDPDWNADGQLCIVQDQPLPTTILSVVSEVARGN